MFSKYLKKHKTGLVECKLLNIINRRKTDNLNKNCAVVYKIFIKN